MKFTSLAFFSILILAGCHYDSGRRDPQTFFKPYENASPNDKKASPMQRRLVQLGLPESDAIIVWYALDVPNPTSGSSRTEIEQWGDLTRAKDVDLKVFHNEKELDKNAFTIEHHYHKVYQTGRIRIGGLQPGASYEVSLLFDSSDNDGGYAESVFPKTKPDKNSTDRLSFLVSSCFQPYNYKCPGAMYAGNANLLRLLRARCLDSDSPPEFWLCLGDQMYVDPGADKDAYNTLAFLYGSKSDRLRSDSLLVPYYLGHLYRYHFALDPMAESLARIPQAMMWDDHEIRDGWGSYGDELRAHWPEYYKDAQQAFEAFQAARNPGFTPAPDRGWCLIAAKPNDTGVVQRHEMDYHVNFGWKHAEVFIFDGKSDRKWGNDKNQQQEIGDVQMESFEQWLTSVKSRYRDTSKALIVSFPVPVASLPRVKLNRAAPGHLTDDARDRISPKLRKFILESLLVHTKECTKHTFILLTGDVHFSALQSIYHDKKDSTPRGIEVISSGLAQTIFATKFTLDNYTVSGSDKMCTAWIDNHGTYVGPCFSEIHIECNDPNNTPTVSVSFYPASADGGFLLNYDPNKLAKRPRQVLPYAPESPNKENEFPRTNRERDLSNQKPLLYPLLMHDIDQIESSPQMKIKEFDIIKNWKLLDP